MIFIKIIIKINTLFIIKNEFFVYLLINMITFIFNFHIKKN